MNLKVCSTLALPRWPPVPAPAYFPTCPGPAPLSCVHHIPEQRCRQGGTSLCCLSSCWRQVRLPPWPPVPLPGVLSLHPPQGTSPPRCPGPARFTSHLRSLLPAVRPPAASPVPPAPAGGAAGTPVHRVGHMLCTTHQPPAWLPAPPLTTSRCAALHHGVSVVPVRLPGVYLCRQPHRELQQAAQLGHRRRGWVLHARPPLRQGQVGGLGHDVGPGVAPARCVCRGQRMLWAAPGRNYGCICVALPPCPIHFSPARSSSSPTSVGDRKNCVRSATALVIASRTWGAGLQGGRTIDSVVGMDARNRRGGAYFRPRPVLAAAADIFSCTIWFSFLRPGCPVTWWQGSSVASAMGR